MKQLFTCILTGLLCSGALVAQPVANVCEPPSAYATIHANNIQAGLLNGGDLFWDLDEAQFIPNPIPGGFNPATIFAAGLWVGGIDPGGNLKLAAQTYRTNETTDFWPGPLTTDGITEYQVCKNWDRFFSVKGKDIREFLEKLPTLAADPAAAIAQYPDIMGWPASGNAYFPGIWGFVLPNTPNGWAEFHDADGDGVYDPLKGDYPVVAPEGKEVVPAEIFWCVFNDEGAGAVHSASLASPLLIEIQLTVWAFHCTDQPVLENSVFTAHKIINRSTERIDSCMVGLWVDFDLGCYVDDFMGCDSALSAFFTYNEDPTDGSTGAICTGGVTTFADNPPVQSVVLLNNPLHRFIYYENTSVGSPAPAVSDPDLPLEFYRYLNGHWRDGNPITYGGTGYQSGGAQANYAFPGDPADPNAWSMCTANLTAGDHRVVASSKAGSLLPGQSAELISAWTVHPDPDLPCGLGSMKNEIVQLRDTYQTGFAGVCSPLTGVSEIPVNRIRVFPNPASGTATVTYGNLSVQEIRLFSPDGRLARVLRNLEPEKTVLDLSGLASGLYTVQLLSAKGTAVSKISILK